MNTLMLIPRLGSFLARRSRCFMARNAVFYRMKMVRALYSDMQISFAICEGG